MIKLIIGYGLFIYWFFFFLLSIIGLIFIIYTILYIIKSYIKEEEMAKLEPDYPKYTDKTIHKSSHIPIPENIKRKKRK